MKSQVKRIKLVPSTLAFALIVLSQITLAAESKSCATIVQTAQEAANKADWIIEGDVTNTFRMNSTQGRIEVSIENAKVIHELEKSPRFYTAVLRADTCFPNAEATLWGQAAIKLTGKRMRFFGTRLTHSGSRRFFFMQPADQAMPSFSTIRKEYTDKEYTTIHTQAGPDGWFRARSTEGGFSIEMPGIFTDISKGSGKEPAFMLRGNDRFGSTFIVVFERSGPGSEMAVTFDSIISMPNAKLTTFKGADAVSTLGELPGSDGARITHGLWFRVPGGTYMLGVVTDKVHETESMKFKERFFNSLAFE